MEGVKVDPSKFDGLMKAFAEECAANEKVQVTGNVAFSVTLHDGYWALACAVRDHRGFYPVPLKWFAANGEEFAKGAAKELNTGVLGLDDETVDKIVSSTMFG